MKLLLKWVLWITCLWALTTIHESAAESIGEKLKKLSQSTKPSMKPKGQEELDKYFESPLPGFDLFNKWFYNAMHNGTDSIYKKFIETYLDPTFDPPKILNDTPFAVPPKFQRLYSWLILHNDTTSQVIPLTEEEYMKKILDHFGGTVKPEYEDYYKWLYELSHDVKGHEARFAAAEAMVTEGYKKNVNNTPFPVPESHRNHFAFICALDDLLGSTGHHYWFQPTTESGQHKGTHDKPKPSTPDTRGISQTPLSRFSTHRESETTAIQRPDLFIGDSIDPFFHEFNKWFLNQQMEDKDWRRKLEKSKHMNLTNNELDETTSFPVPEKYLQYYLLANMAPELIDELLVPIDVDDSLVNYDNFYDWYHNASNKDVHSLERACAQVLFHNDSITVSTPFPIPKSFRKAFCWSIVNHKLTNVTAKTTPIKTTPTTPTTTIPSLHTKEDLKKFTFPTPMAQPSYYEFNAWLQRALNYGKDSLDQRINESRHDTEFDMKKIDVANTPFPIPIRYNRLYHWLESKNKGQRIYPEAPKHTDFNQWLHKALNNGATPVDQALKDCAHDRSFDVRKITATTPFPIPLKFNRLYYWLSQRKGSDDPSGAKESPSHSGTQTHQKIEPRSQDSPIFQQFNDWFDKIIKSQSIADSKIKDSFLNREFNLQKQIAEDSTPFPLPEPYARLFHWVQYENEHGKSTSSSTSRGDIRHDAKHTSTPTTKHTAHTIIPMDSPLLKPFHEWFDKIIKSPGIADSKLNDSFLHSDFNLIKEIAEGSTPFPLPEPYVRLYYWVQHENQHDNKSTNQSTPGGQVKHDTKHIAHTIIPIEPPVVKSFQEWFDKIIKSPAMADSKIKDSFLDPDFNLIKEIAEGSTPFPLPEPYQRLYYWVQHEKEHHDKSTSTSTPRGEVRHDAKHTPTQTPKTAAHTMIPMDSPLLKPFHEWFDKIIKSPGIADSKLNDSFLHSDFNLIKEIAEGSTPFPLPEPYVRLYYWVQHENQHDNKSTNQTTPGGDARHDTKHVAHTKIPMDSPLLKPFQEWFDKVIKSPAIADAKIKASFLNHDFNLAKQMAKESTPFPLPEPFVRLYHWVQYQNEHAPQSTHPSTSATKHTPHTALPLDSPLLKPFHDWFDEVIKSSAVASSELKASRLDKEFDLAKEMSRKAAPFPIPESYVRLYYWKQYQSHHKKPAGTEDVKQTHPATTQTKPHPITTSSAEPSHQKTSKSQDILKEFLHPSTLTAETLPVRNPIYQHFYDWINSVTNDTDNVHRQIQQSHLDRNFNLEKERVAHSPPFSIPPHYQRYYFWMQYQKRTAKTANTTHQQSTVATTHSQKTTSHTIAQAEDGSTINADSVLSYIKNRLDKWFYATDYTRSIDNGQTRRVFKSKYDDFTRWFAAFKRDKTKYDKFLDKVSRIPDILDLARASNRTSPFPIPDNKRKIFAYVMALDNAAGFTDNHFWLKENYTTPMSVTDERE